MRTTLVSAICGSVLVVSAAAGGVSPDPRAMTLRASDMRSLGDAVSGYVLFKSHAVTNKDVVDPVEGPSTALVKRWGRLRGHAADFARGPQRNDIVKSEAETYRTSKGARAALDYLRAAARKTTEVRWKPMPTLGPIGERVYA
jgi:hypothetical protein